jgi:Flp pilus assembly protein TadD
MYPPARVILAMTIRELLDTGRAAHRAGQFAEAEEIYRQVLRREPGSAAAMHLLGVLALQAGRHAEAVELIQQAIARRPRAADFHCNLALALAGVGKFDEAVAALERALELRPGYAEAYSNLGLVLGKQRRTVESIAAHQRALELRPGVPDIHVNLGSALVAAGRPHDALAEYRRALQIQSDHAMAHWNLGLTLLLLGDYAQGWEEYEWRHAAVGAAAGASSGHRFPGPQWDGSDLAGHNILLYNEQGLGDMIQFARFVPLVARRGGRVLLECGPELAPLMCRLEGVAELVDRGAALPAGAAHCSLMSLPRVFGTTLQTIPALVPYLVPDAQKTAQWRSRLDAGGDQGQEKPVLNVGLVWAGRLRPNPHRSIGLSALAPLGEIAGVRFVSLQKGEASQEAPVGMRLTDWTAALNDFGDTAALIANLDLVISIDSAAAHLAGAMGKTAWVMLTFDADWRWLLERPDSPWYPTMRLFRQEKMGDWTRPIAEVAAYLREMAHKGAVI